MVFNGAYSQESVHRIAACNPVVKQHILEYKNCHPLSLLIGFSIVLSVKLIHHDRDAYIPCRKNKCEQCQWPPIGITATLVWKLLSVPYITIFLLLFQWRYIPWSFPPRLSENCTTDEPLQIVMCNILGDLQRLSGIPEIVWLITGSGCIYFRNLTNMLLYFGTAWLYESHIPKLIAFWGDA